MSRPRPFTVPLLTWVGDVLGLVGGLGATAVITHITTRAYIQATMNAITAEHFLAGFVKTPFLGSRDRIDRLWSGAARTGRFRRCRHLGHDHRGRAGHLQRDCDQLHVHILFRAHRHLNMPLPRPHITVEKF